jgi:hypothetical protein
MCAVRKESLSSVKGKAKQEKQVPNLLAKRKKTHSSNIQLYCQGVQ